MNDSEATSDSGPRTPGIEQYYEQRKWLNVSTLTATARCPRKAFYQSGCLLDSPGEKPALVFGESIHNAVPQLLSGDKATTLQRAINAFNVCWEPSLSDDKRNELNARKMLLDFAATHGGKNGLYELVHPKDLPFASDIVLDLSDRVSEYELPFIIDIGLSVPLVGRIDGIGRLRDTGEYCLVEYKTTSSTWQFFDAFQLSPQVLLYNLGARTSLPGIEFKKCVVEALEVSKTKTSTTANPITIMPWHVEECLDWARFFGNLFLDCERRGHFPKWFSGCHPYSMFGSRGYLCDYYNLCQPKDWTSTVSLYVKRKDRRYEILFPDKKTTLEVSS